jgi:hypothetical protein
MQLRYQDWILAISFVTAFHAYSMGIQWYRSAQFGGIAWLNLRADELARTACLTTHLRRRDDVCSVAAELDFQPV